MTTFNLKMKINLLILLVWIGLATFVLLETYIVPEKNILPKNNIVAVQDNKFAKETPVGDQKDSYNNCTQKFKSSHFMTSKVYGQIGNQLFAISTLIAAANESCYTPFIDTRLGMDEYFDIKNVVRSEIKRINFRLNRERCWGKYAGSIAKQINPGYNVTILGSRESFKYFIHKSDLVRSSIVFKKEIKDAVAKYLEENSLLNRTKIGIHVRRGDFLRPENIRLGFVVSSLYFIVKAITYFENHFVGQDLAFLVASNDIKWCKENIRGPNTYFSPFDDPGKDLHILTQCDHNIVTVGTFGWMGAWLNETGTVIYDKSYTRFNSSMWHYQRKEDLFPQWWIGM